MQWGQDKRGKWELGLWKSTGEWVYADADEGCRVKPLATRDPGDRRAIGPHQHLHRAVFIAYSNPGV